MSRLKHVLDLGERKAVSELIELADSLQDTLYYANGDNLAPRTIRALNTCYRVLKPAVEFYYGADHCLVYDAPDGRFTSKGAAVKPRTK